MKLSIHRPAHALGVAAAGVLAASALLVAAPAASADPLTDLLCNSGSAQFCPPARPAPGAPAPGVYYKNCDAARDAGVAPLHRGDPGYAPHLDRDNDGIACE
ncbi:excalibur calcium-binding domain-containing protein [Nocardia cyriacigeorgica]|uniref:excalibur calcium-binding domain-containing protein n=1 Tax=Nocardia cyriacigeorgica TaxID=135487 RepID=UPI0018957030|nr:excalibur calcium-binding domain-containing protein [Nocardia cyriacigeorgica]MBF6453061.1 excalibur calcium-binding domain-containing protein [Nocardia cyriacigeorgica]MBF6478568.1 excalibur calcium-binding domain-containing protein [Nocardia cyriacigeorgica]MBF6550230.1 excalibur calcium-binding domain-containing protein [Nocardia cyriacigeorgica]